MKRKVIFDAANYISEHASRTGIYRYIEGLLGGLDSIAGSESPEFGILSESPVSKDFDRFIDNIIYTAPIVNTLRRFSYKHPSLIHGAYQIENLLQSLNDYDIYHVLDVGNFTRYKKCVTTFYDITPVLHPEWHMDFVVKLHRYKLNIARKKSMKIICISEHTREDLLNHGIKEENIRVTHLALPLNLQKYLNNTALDIDTVKRKYPYPFFLSVCTIEPRKNIRFLIESFIRLKKESQKFKDIKLLLVGSIGWLNDSFPVHEDIIFTGFIDDHELACLYKFSMAFIYPSLYEGFGLPVLEGMALGSAVITSRVSSLPEVGGDAVIYIDPTDADDLISNMKRIVSDSRYSESFRRKGIERAKLFSWEKTAGETVVIYDYFFK